MRLQVINEIHLSQHHYLTVDDECYFFGELSPGRDNWTVIKSLVHNLKKKPSEPTYIPYKQQAISQAIELFENVINSSSIETVTLVPIPPSKCPEDPEYDNRMWTVLEGLKNKLKDRYSLDIRKLVYQTESYVASHTTTDRITPEKLESIYQIDENFLEPEPSLIILIDDVLTSGCHHKVMKSILQKKFPNAKVKAIFLARRQIDYGAIFGVSS